MKTAVSAIVLGVVLLLGACVMSTKEPVDLKAGARAASYLVDTPLGNGSATLVLPGLLLTAAHVVEDMGPVTVSQDGVDFIEAEILFLNAEADIAILKAALVCPCAPIASREVIVGEPVVVVGYPLGLKVQVLTHGVVQGPEPGEGYVVITAPIAPGNSGGGAFIVEDNMVKIIGMTLVQPVVGFYGAQVFYLGGYSTRAIIYESLGKVLE